jgi:hypothetical protein
VCKELLLCSGVSRSAINGSTLNPGIAFTVRVSKKANAELFVRASATSSYRIVFDLCFHFGDCFARLFRNSSAAMVVMMPPHSEQLECQDLSWLLTVQKGVSLY